LNGEGSEAPVIPRYTDHAANERTFLAWVRVSTELVLSLVLIMAALAAYVALD
jgi:uncharacterized membrane protein YidH (DUF202 family)